MATPSPHEAGNLWRDLQSQIRDYLKNNTLSWKYDVDLDVPKDDAKTKWLEDCGRHRQEVNGQVRQLIAQGTLHQEDPEMRYWIAIRFAAAEELVTQCFWMERLEMKSCFLPVSLDRKVMLSFMLIDWWWGSGVFSAFDRVWEGKLYAGLA